MSTQDASERPSPALDDLDVLGSGDAVVVETVATATGAAAKVSQPGFTSPEKSIPFRKGDLSRLLNAEPGLTEEERGQFAQFGKLLAATLSHEFAGRLNTLKELYAPLDPDAEELDLPGISRVRATDSDEKFLHRLDKTLNLANYRPLTLQSIEEAITSPNETGLNYIPDFSLFEHLKVYVRGHAQITREYRGVNTTFRKRRITLDAHRRMVLALKFRQEAENLGPFVRTDVVYLRMFKDVPHVDMEMHLPEQGTRVKMRWIDKAQIASPLMTGIPMALAKLMLATAISPFMALGLMVAPITAGVNSFFGYQRSKRNHLYAMIHRLYYLTIANNASVLTRLIDSATDEEYKEALLAYFFLWRARSDPDRWHLDRLDREVEAFIRARSNAVVNFEVGDALAKLFRLDLAHADADGHLRARPIGEALAILDRRWDDVFRFSRDSDRR